jgi:nucleobase:cation symporter-1, NCS1 family
MVLPPIAGFSYTGWFPNHVTNGVDYSWLVGLVVSGLVYWVLSRSPDLTAEQTAIEASERQLRAIDVAAEEAGAREAAATEPPADTI